MDDVNPVEAQPVDTQAPEAAAEPVAAPEAAPPAAAPAAPAAPEFDYRAAYQRQQEQFGALQKQLAEQSQWQKQMQDYWHRAIDPQDYERSRAPRYVTVDQLEQVQAKAVQEARVTAMVERFHGELAAAKERHPEVFAALPGAEDVIGRIWEKTGKSPVQIAKEYGDALTKEYERRQAAHIAGKSAVAQATAGSPRAGAAPASTREPKHSTLSGLFDSWRSSG
jgi:hypothetical protein